MTEQIEIYSDFCFSVFWAYPLGVTLLDPLNSRGYKSNEYKQKKKMKERDSE